MNPADNRQPDVRIHISLASPTHGIMRGADTIDTLTVDDPWHNADVIMIECGWHVDMPESRVRYDGTHAVIDGVHVPYATIDAIAIDLIARDVPEGWTARPGSGLIQFFRNE